MKRICRLILMCSAFFIVIALSPLAAEQKESEVYYVNTQLLKICPHAKGYYVVYRRAGGETAEAHIPYAWFDARESKADITFINSRVNPYLSFFMRNGTFEYVRVSAPSDLKSSVWGLLANPQQHDDKFEGVETLPLEF
ncbi:MAG: hypothetical protein ACTTH8_00265 [Treponema sp.]